MTRSSTIDDDSEEHLLWTGKPGSARLWHHPELTTGERQERLGSAKFTHERQVVAGEITELCFSYRVGDHATAVCASPGAGTLTGDWTSQQKSRRVRAWMGSSWNCRSFTCHEGLSIHGSINWISICRWPCRSGRSCRCCLEAPTVGWHLRSPVTRSISSLPSGDLGTRGGAWWGQRRLPP